jgi:hypothetical protein
MKLFLVGAAVFGAISLIRYGLRSQEVRYVRYVQRRNPMSYHALMDIGPHNWN